MLALLIESDAFARDLLADYLARSLLDFTVITAYSISEAIRQASSAGKVDVIVVDPQALNEDRYGDIGMLKDAFEKAPVVMLSHNEDAKEILQAYACDVDGVVPKILAGRILSLAVELVLRGEKFIPSIVLSRFNDGDDKAGIDPPPAPNHERLQCLTKREQDVLALLFDGNTNPEIAAKLNITANTVRLYLSGVYRKLSARNRLDAVKIATELGFRTAKKASRR